jgi:hypothetical protein
MLGDDVHLGKKKKRVTNKQVNRNGHSLKIEEPGYFERRLNMGQTLLVLVMVALWLPASDLSAVVRRIAK